MEKASVGKVCAWNDLVVDDAPGPARCRISGYLRASADICVQFEPSSIVWLMQIVAKGSTPTKKDM